MSKFIDLKDKTFGLWGVIKRGPNTKNGQAQWYCKCMGCNDIHLIPATMLKTGKSTKCKHCGNKKHGGTLYGHHVRLYRIWLNMRDRTVNPNNPKYKYYGGKGITICNEWNNFEIFREWAKENGYEDNLTIDRINNDKGYFPENCRWVTHVQQVGNTTRKSNSRFIGVKTRYWKTRTSYEARIESSEYCQRLGTFDDPVKAAFARDFYLMDNNLLHKHNGNFIKNQTLEHKEI